MAPIAPIIIKGATALVVAVATITGKRLGERLLPPPKKPFVQELGEKAAIAAIVAASAAAGKWAVDEVKRRRNETSDSNGVRKKPSSEGVSPSENNRSRVPSTLLETVR